MAPSELKVKIAEKGKIKTWLEQPRVMYLFLQRVIIALRARNSLQQNTNWIPRRVCVCVCKNKYCMCTVFCRYGLPIIYDFRCGTIELHIPFILNCMQYIWTFLTLANSVLKLWIQTSCKLSLLIKSIHKVACTWLLHFSNLFYLCFLVSLNYLYLYFLVCFLFPLIFFPLLYASLSTYYSATFYPVPLPRSVFCFLFSFFNFLAFHCFFFSESWLLAPFSS